jgi:curved DNA-binding protein CbpA
VKKKLPDYYAILRVRRDAPQEAIKASFRKLMVDQKMHPDLGGDHNAAAEINDAYAVLSDRAKRSRYDQLYFLQRMAEAQGAATAKGGSASGGSQASAAYKTGSAAAGGCPFCGAMLAKSIRPESRCEYCRSPLAPPPEMGAFGRELFGRRASPRTKKSHSATIYPAGRAESFAVTMRDLSLNGISFYSQTELGPAQRFKFRDANLEAVAAVVSCRKRGESYTVHAKLLTVAFHYKAGLFVSAAR